MTLIFILILCLSMLLALRSMKDFDIPQEIRQLIKTKNIRGSILFFKDKIEHHSSVSSSSSSPE